MQGELQHNYDGLYPCQDTAQQVGGLLPIIIGKELVIAASAPPRQSSYGNNPGAVPSQPIHPHHRDFLHKALPGGSVGGATTVSSMLQLPNVDAIYDDVSELGPESFASGCGCG